jgi:hypothetical protein
MIIHRSARLCKFFDSTDSLLWNASRHMRAHLRRPRISAHQRKRRAKRIGPHRRKTEEFLSVGEQDFVPHAIAVTTDATPYPKQLTPIAQIADDLFDAGGNTLRAAHVDNAHHVANTMRIPLRIEAFHKLSTKSESVVCPESLKDYIDISLKGSGVAGLEGQPLVFHLVPELLDAIELRAVRWQEVQRQAFRV